MEAQREHWKNAHETPNQTVEQAAANAILAWQRYKDLFVGGFNWAIQQYNATHPPSGYEAMAPLDISQQAVPLPGVTPSGAAQLNLPSYGVAATRNCAGFYPRISMRLAETGRVSIAFDVGADGVVLNPHITQSSGYARLDDAAIACVSEQWRNMPEIRDGVPVASPGHQTIVSFDVH
jgi:TonB family protein